MPATDEKGAKERKKQYNFLTGGSATKKFKKRL